MEEFVNELLTALQEELQRDLKKEIGPGLVKELADIPSGVPLLRKNTARILHTVMRRLGIADLEDISPAEVLQDLYDCRVCVNHIAQVYLRGIMAPANIPGAVLFDGRGETTVEDEREDAREDAREDEREDAKVAVREGARLYASRIARIIMTV